MRIVPNLNNINECPNCGRHVLTYATNNFGRPFVLCANCHEEIFENETTCSEEQHTVDHIEQIFDADKPFSKKQKNPNEMVEEYLERERHSAKLFEARQAAKEGFIFEMREEINHLSWSIHDARSIVLVENIQNIFNRIIDYIEEN